jgi:hypothetical protein
MQIGSPLGFAAIASRNSFPTFVSGAGAVGIREAPNATFSQNCSLAWLAVWVAMGPSRWLLRLLLALVAGVVLYSAFVLGVGNGKNHPPDVSEMFRAIPILPLAILSTALPLLVLRGVTGWRIAFIDRTPVAATTATRRFAIRDLFAVTAAVAVSLGLSRIGLKWIWADNEASVVIVFVSLILTGLSLFMACPCVWSSLRVRSMFLGSVMATAYAGALGIVEALGIRLLPRGPRSIGLWTSSTSELLLGLIWFNAAAVLTLHGSLLLARGCGYALLRMPRRRSSVDRAAIDPAILPN